MKINIIVSIFVLAVVGFVIWAFIYQSPSEKAYLNSPRVREAKEYMSEFYDRTNKDGYSTDAITELTLKIKEIEANFK